MFVLAAQGRGLIGHVTFAGPVVFVSEGLFFAGIAAGIGAYQLHHRGHPPVLTYAAGTVAIACFVVATILPVLIAPTLLSRPSSSARLTFLTPTEGAAIGGDPADVHVRLGLVGGTIVPFTSLHLVPGEGHVHLYLDGRLIAMTGLESEVSVRPGTHTLTAEFVAVDHGPFLPRVTARVTFSVHP